MDTDASVFARLIRQAASRDAAAPLLRALGFEPRYVPVPPAARASYGLRGDEPVESLVVAAERDGLTVLLLELETPPAADPVGRIARRIHGHNPVRPRLFLFAGPGYRRLVLASFGLAGELRRLTLERNHLRPSDLEALAEMAAGEEEGGVALALRHARALDRSRLNRQFFRDFRAQRDHVAGAWQGLPEGLEAERAQLSLLFLCRLMFLYFLQRQGHLAGDRRYLPRLHRRWQRDPGPGTFYRQVLGPLFFGALNTRPPARGPAARALGPLPYLNGGLFERHALERRHPALDLPDAVVTAVFDELLERYRFTVREASDAAVDHTGEVGVDPEMLGRVFEGLMEAGQRGDTGTYYTPAATVDRLVRQALSVHLAGLTGLPRPRAAALMGRGDAGASGGGGGGGAGAPRGGAAAAGPPPGAGHAPPHPPHPRPRLWLGGLPPRRPVPPLPAAGGGGGGPGGGLPAGHRGPRPLRRGPPGRRRAPLLPSAVARPDAGVGRAGGARGDRRGSG